MPLPSLFVSHGGGPCFFMREEDCSGPLKGLSSASAAAQSFRDVGRDLRLAHGADIKAVLVVTAHWEGPGDAFRVSTSAAPTLLYDYGGFPGYTFDIKYPCPGAPGVAARVRELLRAEGLACEGDSERGLDHGVFLPAKLMFPDAAATPVVALSIAGSLNGGVHARAGRALAALRNEGVLIIGSGQASHNFRDLRKFSFGADPAPHVRRFGEFMDATMALPAAQRTERLADVDKHFAEFRQLHPREEHYLPLVVAAAAAEDEERPPRKVVDMVVGGYFDLGSWQFGGNS